MAGWTLHGMRLDIALAVVLEVSVLELSQADSDAQRRRAMAFNEHLWQVASALAPTAPEAEDRAMLPRAAAQVKAGTCAIAQLVDVNRGFARQLAGRAATDGALGQILERWRTARRAGTSLEFGPWLLDLLDGFAGHGGQALAA